MNKFIGPGLAYKRWFGSKSIARQLKDAGAVLALLSTKADGSAPLTGNSSPWVDLSGNSNDGTLTNFAGTESSGWNKLIAPQSKNRFDKNTALFDKAVGQADGALTNRTGWYASDYILINGGTDYTQAFFTGSSSSGYAFYDYAKNYISGGNSLSFTTPANAVFVRISWAIGSGSVDLQQVEEGLTPTPYESFTGKDEHFLTFDGVDDYVQFADTPSLDITSAPLAIGHVVKLPNTETTAFAIAKDSGSTTTVQYGSVLRPSSGTMSIYLENASRGTFAFNTDVYTSILMYWDGVNVRYFVDDIEIGNSPYAGTLTSRTNVSVGRLSNNSFLIGGDMAISLLFGNNIDINKARSVLKKISAPYLALNK